MSKVGVNIESVQVIEGQGAVEGDFELRVQVQEGNNQVVWPSLNSWVKVQKNGPPETVNRRIAVYPVNSGTLSKRFTIDVTEVDGGALGKDDVGQGTLTFDLTPDMAPQVKSATIALKRPNMKKYNGKVKVVTLAAQRV
jgi:hypothetical protein